MGQTFKFMFEGALADVANAAGISQDKAEEAWGAAVAKFPDLGMPAVDEFVRIMKTQARAGLDVNLIENILMQGAREVLSKHPGYDPLSGGAG